MERHERPSAQVGLLRHPPSVNVSGGTVRELACRKDGESVGEGFARRGWDTGNQGLRSILIFISE